MCETYSNVSEESGDRVKKGQPSVGLSTLALSQLCVADRVSDLAVLSSFVLREGELVLGAQALNRTTRREKG